MFSILLAILSISIAEAVHMDDACLLAATTEDHHHRFSQLYPEQRLTPKMHYMVHLPQQLLKYVC